MFGYFDKKLEAMQNQIDQKYREPLRKRAIHNDYFKSKVNFQQFKFNSGLQENIKDIHDDHLHESTVEALKAIVSKISKRNKIIKNTDCSPAGWATIVEYQDDPFGSVRKILRKFGKMKIEP